MQCNKVLVDAFIKELGVSPFRELLIQRRRKLDTFEMAK